MPIKWHVPFRLSANLVVRRLMHWLFEYSYCCWFDIWYHKNIERHTAHTIDDVIKLNIFRVTGPLCGEFTGPGEFPTQRQVTRSFDVFFDLRLNKRLSKQPWGWWFETPSWSLWRQCNVHQIVYSSSFVSKRGYAKCLKYANLCFVLFSTFDLFVKFKLANQDVDVSLNK